MEAKFGDLYDKACQSETEPLECKPDSSMINQHAISEFTGLEFPDVKVLSCVSLLRHFTGDYRDCCHVSFIDPIPVKTIEAIKSDWNKCHTCDIVGNEVSFNYEYKGDDPQFYWAITLVLSTNEATIVYGKN